MAGVKPNKNLCFLVAEISRFTSQNAGKCVSESLEFQKFLGQHALGEQDPRGLAPPTKHNATSTLKSCRNTVLDSDLSAG